MSRVCPVFCLALNGMAHLVTLRPSLSPHVRSSLPATQEVGFANTITLGSSPSFYADPGSGLAFWEARSHRTHGPAGLPAVVGILPFPGQRRGMLNATSPTGVTCAFVSLSVVNTGCFQAARLTPICISSSKVSYPYVRIIEEAIFLSRLRSQLSISAVGLNTRIESEFTPPALNK
ncbi:uncharacterized protein HKW66_Vig0079810 [Vigna angularis]|uniref:Secreted protein n=1 Tax=Phaseolus angularis TaxID=3914 RepID=A0A8T0K4R4_PHAAN|nr:uncharacterized protein HKW66_Vig0079810 [Vigna angularis]